ncbi:MAG: DHA2 family efflux MFS transporter permease subunit [Aeromicrobium sp.]|nr:MAG: DHA2 family efflux MFS transporter permease subunit [Aeromicrobium sp.]
MSRSHAASSTGEVDEKIDASVLIVAGVVVMGSIMSILDITVVNVAIPTFLTEFEVDKISTVAWVVTAYTLALAAVIPMTGWAADRFGTKRLYMLALALFTAGSVLCAMAWSIESLIAFRVVQGLGGGMLMPLGMTIMTRAAGPKRMGRLMAILGIPMLLGPIAGPILGGWLIEVATWHWIFLINLPLGIGALIYAALALPKDEAHPSETFDFVGMLMMSPGLALFLYGVSSIPEVGGMDHVKVWGTMLGGALLIAAFVVYSFKPAHPLLDLRLFKNFNLTISILTMFLFASAFFGGLFLVPTYLQQVGGETALGAGLLMAPQGLGAMLTMPLAGILADRFPVGRIVPFGIAVITGGMFALTKIDADTSNTHLMINLFILGLGMGLTMMPIMSSALRTLRPHEIARGSTLLNITQQIASSMGVATISVVLVQNREGSKALAAAEAMSHAQMAGTQPPADVLAIIAQYGESFQSVVLDDLTASFAAAFFISCIMCGVAFLASLLLPKKRSADETENTTPVVIH